MGEATEGTKEFMKKRFKKRYGMGHPCSGGLRVKEEGVIEVKVEAIVLTGFHNERDAAYLVKPGFRFYSHFGFGAWTDVIPVWECKRANAYARIADRDNGDARERRNKKFIVAKVDHNDL